MEKGETNSIITKSTISDAGNGLSCLETVINVKLADASGVNEASNNDAVDAVDKVDNNEDKFNPEKVKTSLMAPSDIMIIADVSDFARDYLQFIIDGVDILKRNITGKQPVIIKWNEYFDARDIDSVSKGGKSNFVLMLSCLRETLEFSRGKFSIILICAGNDNVNEAAAIFNELDQLRAVIDKQHVDIHCIGIGNQHDVIILDLLARMATGRSTYQTASGGDNIVNRITSLAINIPSLRVNYRIDGKLYKADVEYSADCIISRIFGKFSPDQKIEVLLANGEYQKTLEFAPEELCIVVDVVAGDATRKNLLRRIKLQLDPICNCLKYEMTEDILTAFRTELTAHGEEIQNILAEIKSQIESVDIGELQFITDIITYHNRLVVQYSNKLVNLNGDKGIIDVSMEDYSRLVSVGFSCGANHSAAALNKTQCIQFGRGNNILPDPITVDMFEKHKKFPNLFETKVGDELFYYPADQSELTKTYIKSLLRIMAFHSGDLSESPIFFEEKFYTPADTRIYDDLAGVVDGNELIYGSVDLFIGAVRYVCEWKKCTGESISDFRENAYNKAAGLAFEQTLAREMASTPGVKLCENLIALIGVNQKHYSDKLNAVKAARSKITAKNMELQAQSIIINELKKRGIKHIKPQGKRSASRVDKGAVDAVENKNKMTSEEIQKYNMNLIGFINGKAGKITAVSAVKAIVHYENWFRSHLYERLVSFAKLYPDIFGTTLADNIYDLAHQLVTSIIKFYISNEKKKILGENDKADRDEKIKAFVTTDRVYAAAGLLRGAFLGVNLSKYLGTLCEAVADGKIKVPLIAEKLYMIITGRLVIKDDGTVLTSPPLDTDNVNSILLVEDIPLHIYQKPFTRMDTFNACTGFADGLTRGQKVKHINKWAANNTHKPGQWVLGKKKLRLVQSFLNVVDTSYLFSIVDTSCLLAKQVGSSECLTAFTSPLPAN